MTTIRITHYSDILCVWAYMCQVRVDELLSNFGEQVELDYCLFPVFGATREKLETVWGARGGAKAYNQHVIEISQQFGHVPVHKDIWMKATPESSLPGHLYLSATKFLEREEKVAVGSFAKLAQEFRHGFFAELRDISNNRVLSDLVKQAGLPVDDIQQTIDSGQAFALMSLDMQQAQKLTIRSSPTMLFNEDRQRLAGNVGYRIIEANIRELLEKPEAQQSWC